jgi:hypothetical protein
MERPELSFKIMLIGNLVLQLQHLSEEYPDDDIEMVEDEFDKTLASLIEMKQIVLEELDEYLQHCKTTNEPVYLPYYTVHRELSTSDFGPRK